MLFLSPPQCFSISGGKEEEEDCPLTKTLGEGGSEKGGRVEEGSKSVYAKARQRVLSAWVGWKSNKIINQRGFISPPPPAPAFTDNAVHLNVASSSSFQNSTEEGQRCCRFKRWKRNDCSPTRLDLHYKLPSTL